MNGTRSPFLFVFKDQAIAKVFAGAFEMNKIVISTRAVIILKTWKLHQPFLIQNCRRSRQ